MTEALTRPHPKEMMQNTVFNTIRVLSHKEVQKHLSGAAVEASRYKEPRHFILFLCGIDFHSGLLLIHYSSGTPTIVSTFQNTRQRKGKKKDISPLKYIFSSCTHLLHFYPIGQNLITWSLFQEIVCLANIRGSITKEGKNRESPMSQMVSTRLSEMSFLKLLLLLF